MPFFFQRCFRSISIGTIVKIIVGVTFITSLAPGQEPVPNTNQITLRTNPEDVQLAPIAYVADLAQSDNASSQDQWKSLATPPPSGSDPMVAPSPEQGISSTKKLTPLPAESKPKPLLKKDEYGAQTGWGIRTAAGVAIQQSINAAIFGGLAHAQYNFDPGFRMDFESFYNITNGFSFGLESACIFNSVSSIFFYGQGQEDSRIAGSAAMGNAEFWQVPILMNMKFQIPNSGRFRGYCLGGFGGVWDYFSYSGVGADLTQHQWNYAFQLGAGFQYNLLPGLDLDTSFKTFITPNPLLFSDGTSQVKASYNYTLEIGLAYRF